MGNEKAYRSFGTCQMRLSFFRDNLIHIGSRLGALVIPDHFSSIRNKVDLSWAAIPVKVSLFSVYPLFWVIT